MLYHNFTDLSDVIVVAKVAVPEDTAGGACGLTQGVETWNNLL